MADKQLPGEGELEVTVVTPRGPVTELRTDAVTAPGEMGEFEVLAGHVPFLTALHAGVLVVGETRGREVYAVGPGYLKVGDAGGVEVMVERAVAAGDIDADTVQKEAKEASDALRDWTGDQGADFRRLEQRNAWAQAQLEARSR